MYSQECRGTLDEDGGKLRTTSAAREMSEATKAQGRQVSLWTKATYGFGAAAYGIKNNGFDYFFLIFYSQVMGVSAYLVSLALLIALTFDAVSDPLIGFL